MFTDEESLAALRQAADALNRRVIGDSPLMGGEAMVEGAPPLPERQDLAYLLRQEMGNQQDRQAYEGQPWYRDLAEGVVEGATAGPGALLQVAGMLASPTKDAEAGFGSRAGFGRLGAVLNTLPKSTRQEIMDTLGIHPSLVSTALELAPRGALSRLSGSNVTLVPGKNGELVAMYPNVGLRAPSLDSLRERVATLPASAGARIPAVTEELYGTRRLGFQRLPEDSPSLGGYSRENGTIFLNPFLSDRGVAGVTQHELGHFSASMDKDLLRAIGAGVSAKDLPAMVQQGARLHPHANAMSPEDLKLYNDYVNYLAENNASMLQFANAPIPKRTSAASRIPGVQSGGQPSRVLDPDFMDYLGPVPRTMPTPRSVYDRAMGERLPNLDAAAGQQAMDLALTPQEAGDALEGLLQREWHPEYLYTLDNENAVPHRGALNYLSQKYLGTP